MAGLRLPDSPKVKGLIAELFDPSHRRSWIVMGYKDKDTCTLIDSGEGGIENVVPHLKPDSVNYFLIRIPVSEEKTRDIFVQWCGPSVSVIRRGKKKGDLGKMTDLLSPSHCEIQAAGVIEKVTEEVLLAKSDPTSGSHVID